MVQWYKCFEIPLVKDIMDEDDDGAHTASEPSGRFNLMNQHFWLQNIKIYHKNNTKCHFAKYSSLHEAIYQATSTKF